MKHITIRTLLLTLMVGLGGCASLSDSMIDSEMVIRNHVLAQKAWGHWSWCYDELDYPMHFAKGFKAGYRDVLDGGSGCQPTLPPQCYWKPYYQTPTGHCQIHAWFDGFSHGALAAKQDGYGAMGEIPISPTARANLEASRRRPDPNMFQAGGYMGGTLPPLENGINLSPPPAPLEGADDGGVENTQPGLPVPMRPYE